VELTTGAALVTGGASGLGKATARHLHAGGAAVVVFDRDEVKAKAVASELGDRATYVAGDVLSEDDTRHAIEAATGLGGLRLVVACAGGGVGGGRTVGRDGSAHSLEAFQATVNLNLVGTFNTLRLSAEAMAKLDPDDEGERGAMVLVASIAGIEGQIGQIAYGSAKAGIIGMTIIAARDLAAIGVRVNTIAPGTIATEAWDLAPPSLREGLEAKVPFPKRLGRPTEFAALAEHLLTNRYMNGHVARVDGAIRFDPK
jgi:NAD(P)-dependent dehydrogenase (short-subunit alcohol dehydrogenase family)